MAPQDGGMLKNDDLPPEEFKDFLSSLDKLITEEGKGFKSLDEAMQEKFDINEVTTLAQRHKNVP